MQEKANPLQNYLSWQGYSFWEYRSQEEKVPTLAHPLPTYAQLPFLSTMMDFLSTQGSETRERWERYLLQEVDHAIPATLTLGVMGKTEAQWIQREITLCFETLLAFTKEMLIPLHPAPAYQAFLAQADPQTASAFQTFMETSRYHYSKLNSSRLNPEMAERYHTAMRQYPLFVDAGADLLYSTHGPVLSEFQIRYMTPYPHLHTRLHQVYEALYPPIFQTLEVQPDAYEERRRQLIHQAWERYAVQGNDTPKRVMIDAWSYQENAGANQKGQAQSLEMDYLLFDTMLKDQLAEWDTLSQHPRLFVFNQPPVSMLDPDHPLFEAINREKLEEYPELGWPGLMEKYLAGNAFFINPPVTDLWNDKAVTGFLPALCEFLLQKTMELPILSAQPFWDPTHPEALHPDTLTHALENREACVIAHRYIEGGMGIRVGKSCSDEEWSAFIETYVSARPWLYILRPYIPMDPDCCLRGMVCGLADPVEPEWHPELITAEDFFGRVSLTSPLSSATAQCFPVVTAQSTEFDEWYESLQRPV